MKPGLLRAMFAGLLGPWFFQPLALHGGLSLAAAGFCGLVVGACFAFLLVSAKPTRAAPRGQHGTTENVVEP